jgi:hypothetical protein
LTQHNSSTTQTIAALETEEVRVEMQKVLESAIFRRSERHSQFLRFVCETALEGNGATLNEYLIAHKVFGRGSEYSPNEDSVVRRQAHSLRQRLSEYYAGEGAADKIRIELPVGRYVPLFTKQSQFEELSPVAPLELAKTSAAAVSAWKRAGVAGAAMVLLGAAWFLGAHTREHKRLEPLDASLEEIWRPWLSAPDGALICFSNPMTTVVKQFPFTLPPDPNGDPPRILVSEEQANELRHYFDLPAGGHFFMYPARSQSKTGEALGSVTLTTMLTKAGVRVQATQSRFLSWDAFRNQNMILLGHDEANRWLDPILEKLPLRMKSTNGEKARRIVDTIPEKGQTAEYYLGKPDVREGISVDYALVSMIGGLDEHHQLLLINGLNTEGTEVAMEYLCNPQTARNLLRQLRKAASQHKGDWRFQMILRTEVRDQVPTKARLLALKVL